MVQAIPSFVWHSVPPICQQLCGRCLFESILHSFTHCFRYRFENSLVLLITPGPTEPNREQMQNYLKTIVDDLIKLHTDGLAVCTPSNPCGTSSFPSVTVRSFVHSLSGILVRVVLIALICDHPAMAKLAGFAEHSHKIKP